jgi:hypothetical protein
MADGFLGRWAQRKQAIREGKPVAEPVVPAPMPAAPVVARTVSPDTPQARVAPAAEVPPPPTLEDVKTLTPESDFQRFVAADVDPEVKHAAMRKLFADPHFNVMDGLDIYIDDYGKPDPLPDSMLRQMASAQFLGLVEEEVKQAVPPTGTPAPAPDPSTSPQTAAAAEPTTAPPAGQTLEHSETTHHDDPDLRLQQDHAPGPEGSGRSA